MVTRQKLNPLSEEEKIKKDQDPETGACTANVIAYTSGVA
jgi:hypothetical protein